MFPRKPRTRQASCKIQENRRSFCIEFRSKVIWRHPMRKTHFISRASKNDALGLFMMISFFHYHPKHPPHPKKKNQCSFISASWNSYQLHLLVLSLSKIRFQPFKYRVILALAAAFFGVKKPRGRWTNPAEIPSQQQLLEFLQDTENWHVPLNSGTISKANFIFQAFPSIIFEMAMLVFEGWHINWEVFFNETFRLPNPNDMFHGHTEIVEL